MTEKAERLQSLDALRGFDMLWIMGGARVVRGFCALWDGGKDWFLCRQMHHVEWEGLAFFDTIFPLFIFIAGASYPFSHAKHVASGCSRRREIGLILRRVALLTVLGIVYEGVLRDGFASFKAFSILGKIGATWGIAALWYLFVGVRARIGVFAVTLAAYWLILRSTGFTSGGGLLSGYFGASASAVLGMLVGDLLRSAREGLTPARKALLLAALGVALLAVGGVASVHCPVIKKLSTPSFMLICGGEACVLFAAFYYVIDVRKLAGWIFPLKVIGMNAIVAYLMQAVVDYMHMSKFFFGSLAALCPTPDFVLGAGYLLLCWLTLWLLHRKRIFLKV